MYNIKDIQAFIFAAGLGTRLKPLTDTKPKALVPVGGRPLIEHVIDKLRSQGIEKYIVNVHHFSEQIKHYLSEREDHESILISDETDMLRETGGAIKHAEELFNGNPFIVHNVDIISNFDAEQLISAHKSDALATLLVSERDTQRYLLFDDEMRLSGWTNIATGEVKTPYEHLEINKCHKLAFSGIHIIDPRICKQMKDWPEKFSIIDFYLSKAREEKIYGTVQKGFKMIDVGKLNTLEEAEKLIEEINREI